MSPIKWPARDGGRHTPIDYTMQILSKFTAVPGVSWNSTQKAVDLSHPFLSRLCAQFCSLHLHLYSCPANSFTCTIFLDSTYMPWYTNFNKFILCSQKNVDQLWLWPPEGFDWQVFCPWWLPSSPLCLHHLGKWDLLLHIFPWKHWDDIWKMWRNQAIQEGRYITSRHLKTTAVHQCFPSVYMNIHNPTHQMSMSVSPLSNNYY